MLRFLFRQRLRKQQTAGETPQEPIARLTESVTHNISMIKELLGYPNDLIIREFRVGPHKHLCSLISIDGLTNADLLDEEVLRVLLSGTWLATHTVPSEGSALLDLLHQEILSVNSIDRVDSLDQTMLGVLSGIAALLVDGSSDALLICSQRWQERPVEEPQTEALIRGPRDGFTENLRTNTALVRRRLRDPHLRYISFRIGRRSRKEVVLAYIDGIAHPELVAEAKRRLDTIDMDEAEGSGYIEQWMMDSFLTPFPLIHSTERPDKTASSARKDCSAGRRGAVYAPYAGYYRFDVSIAGRLLSSLAHFFVNAAFADGFRFFGDVSSRAVYCARRISSRDDPVQACFFDRGLTRRRAVSGRCRGAADGSDAGSAP